MSGDLVKALQRLYETETNINISSFWDSGWTVRLGDELNGHVAERTFHNDELGEVAEWIEGQRAEAREAVGAGE